MTHGTAWFAGLSSTAGVLLMSLRKWCCSRCWPRAEPTAGHSSPPGIGGHPCLSSPRVPAGSAAGSPLGSAQRKDKGWGTVEWSVWSRLAAGAWTNPPSSPPQWKCARGQSCCPPVGEDGRAPAPGEGEEPPGVVHALPGSEVPAPAWAGSQRTFFIPSWQPLKGKTLQTEHRVGQPVECLPRRRLQREGADPRPTPQPPRAQPVLGPPADSGCLLLATGAPCPEFCSLSKASLGRPSPESPAVKSPRTELRHLISSGREHECMRRDAGAPCRGPRTGVSIPLDCSRSRSSGNDPCPKEPTEPP